MQDPNMLASNSIDMFDSYVPANLWNMIGAGANFKIIAGSALRSADILRRLQSTMPNVNAVCLPEGGCCRFHAVVQISKKFESDSMGVIVGVLNPTEASRDIK